MEVDLAGLRERLGQLDEELAEVQERAAKTIKARRAEFATAFDQVGELNSTIETVWAELRKTSALLGNSKEEKEGEGDSKSLPAKLRSAAEQHAAASAAVADLDDAAKVLTALLEAQGELGRLDALLQSMQYRDAAELSNELSKSLQALSGPATSSEPALLRAVKGQYEARRRRLALELEEVLKQLCIFEDNCAIAAPTAHPSSNSNSRPGGATATAVGLAQVWDALSILGLRDRFVGWLAAEAHRGIVKPLLQAGQSLSLEKSLEGVEAVSPNGDGRIIWRWREVARKDAEHASSRDANGGGSKPAAKAFVPALESLLAFGRVRWAGDSAEVYAALGRRLWPQITRYILKHFDTSGDDRGVALESFEQRLAAANFMDGGERTLAKHVLGLRRVDRERERYKLLSQARTALLEGCNTTAEVGVDDLGFDEEEEEMDEQAVPLPEDDDDDGLMERVHLAATSDFSRESLLPMKVSRAVQQFVKWIRGLVSDAERYTTQGRLDEAADVDKLIKELCTLFAVLRPFIQKGQLRTDATYCSVLLTDCLYLAYMLRSMLPAGHQHKETLEELALQVSCLGERYFAEMLRNQHEQIATIMQPCDLSRGNMVHDQYFVSAETALAAAVQHVRSTSANLRSLLPPHLLKEAVVQLLSSVPRALLGTLFQAVRMTPDEVHACSTLLISAVSMGSKVMHSAGLPASPGSYAAVPGWSGLLITSQLLGSDFPRIRQRRVELLQALRRKDVMRLLELSLRDDMFGPDDAYRILTTS